MPEIKELRADIEKLRENLDKLIGEKANLLDSEVYAASKILNAAIVQYNKILEEKIRAK